MGRLTMKALCEPGLGASAKLLLAYWCERANAVTRICWPGRALTIKETGLSQPTFYRAKAELIERGLMADLPDADGHTERIQVYPDHSQIENGNSQIENGNSQIENGNSQIENGNSQIENGNSQIENHIIRNELFRNSSINSSVNLAHARQPATTGYVPGSDDDAVAAWKAIQKGAGSRDALGLKRDHSGGHDIPLGANKALLWVQNWADLRKADPAPTLADCEKLGRWIAAGGNGDITPWQLLARGGNAENIGAWLDKAERWDGINDPRPQRGAPRAPRMMGEERHQEEARIADEQANDTAYIRAQLDEARADAAAREEEERRNRHGRGDD